jgi:hypothetical protein
MAQGQILGIPRLRDATLRSVAPLGMTQPGMSRKTIEISNRPTIKKTKGASSRALLLMPWQ